MNYYFKIIFICFFVISLLLSWTTRLDQFPRLHNEVPSYLEEFKRKVELQALEYGASFHLSGSRDSQAIALTFDDGPESEYTPAILDILAEKGVSATFFLLGERIEAYPDLTKRIAEEGHQVANHSWSHIELTELTKEEAWINEIAATSDRLEDITGAYTTYFRPPYGSINNSLVEKLSAKDWQVINWSIDSFDWLEEKNDAEAIVDRIDNHLHSGAIILLHTNSAALEALPEVITKIKQRGYEFKTVKELIEN